MKATAQAPANIAFIKYWGKKDEERRLPLNSSISMNLSEAYTVTTVNFSPEYTEDYVVLLNETAISCTFKRQLECARAEVKTDNREVKRVREHLDRLRSLAKSKHRARVITRNTFPKSTGIASSASGFAALTVAASRALGLNLSEKELTMLARVGSGSACRSIPDGFVEWVIADDPQNSYAYSLYPHDWWDLRDVLIVTETRRKKMSSTDAMAMTRTSPYLSARLDGIEDRILKVKEALKKKDFSMFGTIIEEDCISMHAVMMTQKPPLYYWNGVTVDIIQAVQSWRGEGLTVYFTIDAGPNVHLICEGKDEEKVVRRAREISGVKNILVNKPAQGARLVSDHLF